MLYVSHGAAIREFITSLVEMADRKERDFELALPAEEAEMIRTGSKRIDNCSRTVIEMEWLDQDTGMCDLQGSIRVCGVLITIPPRSSGSVARALTLVRRRLALYRLEPRPEPDRQRRRGRVEYVCYTRITHSRVKLSQEPPPEARERA